MRFCAGFLICVTLLAISQARSRDLDFEQQKKFAVEKHDLEELKAQRVSKAEAIGMIKWLIFSLFASFAAIVFFKLYWFKSDVESNTFRTVNKKANTTGQGADIDPYRGIGNDPL